MSSESVSPAFTESSESSSCSCCEENMCGRIRLAARARARARGDPDPPVDFGISELKRQQERINRWRDLGAARDSARALVYPGYDAKARKKQREQRIMDHVKGTSVRAVARAEKRAAERAAERASSSGDAETDSSSSY